MSFYCTLGQNYWNILDGIEQFRVQFRVMLLFPYVQCYGELHQPRYTYNVIIFDTSAVNLKLLLIVVVVYLVLVDRTYACVIPLIGCLPLLPLQIASGCCCSVRDGHGCAFSRKQVWYD